MNGEGTCDTENQTACDFHKEGQRGNPAPAQSGQTATAWRPTGPVLTRVPTVALVADFAQAVKALVDAPQPVLQLRVPGPQHLCLPVAHVLGADGVLLNLCRNEQSADIEVGNHGFGGTPVHTTVPAGITAVKTTYLWEVAHGDARGDLSY